MYWWLVIMPISSGGMAVEAPPHLRYADEKTCQAAATKLGEDVEEARNRYGPNFFKALCVPAPR